MSSTPVEPIQRFTLHARALIAPRGVRAPPAVARDAEPQR